MLSLQSHHIAPFSLEKLHAIVKSILHSLRHFSVTPRPAHWCSWQESCHSKQIIPESLVSRPAGQGERRLWERDCSQIHLKRGNMRNGGCRADIVNIHRLFPKGWHTMNAKMMSHLKDLGITLSLWPILVHYNGKYGEGSKMKRRWRVKSVAMNCRTCKEQRIVLPSCRCFSLFKRLQLRMECCLIIK